VILSRYFLAEINHQFADILAKVEGQCSENYGQRYADN